MGTEINIHDIGEQEGLRVVETTSERNGYPRNCKFALVGLGDFKQAEDLAKKYNLNIINLSKHDGWALWHRGGMAYGPISFDESWICDDERLLKKSALENFFQDEVIGMLENVIEFEEACAIMKNAKEIYEELQNIDDDEQLLLNCGQFIGIYPLAAMELSYDTRMYAIALCEN